MNKQAILDWVLRAAIALLSLLVSVIAWQGQQVLGKIDDHESRLIRIEASRFTYEDGEKLKEAVNLMRVDLGALKQAAGERDRRLERIETKLDTLVERVKP
jgi:hypothetical protein